MGIIDEPRKAWWLVLVLVLAPALYCLYSPLMLSIDSLYGFLAYKGSLMMDRFNVVAEVSPANINQLQPAFISWWSPGQWLVPGIIAYITGLPLGIASIMATLVFALIGMAGYYKVYRYYGFPPSIIFLSLCGIGLSETFNNSFLFYQGGEMLSFGVFPWFFLFVMQTSKPSAGRLVAITLFFLACFVAKTTLVIYCGLVLLYKMIDPFSGDSRLPENRRWIKPAHILYIIPVLVAIGIIHFFFMIHGPTPHLIGKPNPTAQSFMMPISSPITSILSFKKLPALAERYLGSRTVLGQLGVIAAYLPFLWMVYWVMRYMWTEKEIPAAYKRVSTITCIGVVAFFVFAYSMGTNIDRSARHFKFVGFYMLPVLLLLLKRRLPPGYFKSIVGALFLVNVLVFVYHKQKLAKGKYIGATFFYRSNEEMTGPDSMDEKSYKKMLQLDERYNRPGAGDKPVIFMVEASPDVALAIRSACITKRQGQDLWQKKYAGRGPAIVACVQYRPLPVNQALLKQKFPDCQVFQLEDQTDGYQYFIIN
jgi:hypothetical protein